jgi:hypothetical protein
MSLHVGLWLTDKEVMAKILGLENPEPIPFERNLSDEVCNAMKLLFIINYKKASLFDL